MNCEYLADCLALRIDSTKSDQIGVVILASVSRRQFLARNIKLDAVDALWETYGPAVLDHKLDLVAKQGPVMGQKLEAVLSVYLKKYEASGAVAPPMVAALGVAGRQGMLTQKASWEFCLIAAHVDEARQRENLKATLAAVQTSLRGLLEGDAALGLDAAPAGEIIDQISLAQEQWSPMGLILARVAEGATPTADDIADVSRQNVGVLQSMNAITKLYQSLIE